MEHLFAGSGLAEVDGTGRLKLPRFVRAVAERRSGDRRLVFAPHESDPCLTGYDPAFRRALFADSERRRLAEEGAAPERAARRARRAFGLAEEADYRADGTIRLPAMARGLGRIERQALFVGTGAAFEIWNPELAARSGDPALAELARWRLGAAESTPEEEGR